VVIKPGQEVDITAGPNEVVAIDTLVTGMPLRPQQFCDEFARLAVISPASVVLNVAQLKVLPCTEFVFPYGSAGVVLNVPGKGKAVKLSGQSDVPVMILAPRRRVTLLGTINDVEVPLFTGPIVADAATATAYIFAGDADSFCGF
jgi:hypothetical protein